MDYTKKPENNQSPDVSNFLFLEKMYGNVHGSSQYSRNANATQGLYCTTSNPDASEIFKQRKLQEKVGLTDKELSHYTNPLLSSGPGANAGDKVIAIERHLKKSKYEEIRHRSFANGVRVVSTFRLSGNFFD
mmetsp:Transcript_46599/g.97914  ORF Transcript_46599/g.97914 Transcript_46599/m.97914 type:complete len:132 (+) Transcript_46599:106-501(+)